MTAFRSAAIFAKDSPDLGEPLSRLVRLVADCGVEPILAGASPKILGSGGSAPAIEEIGCRADVAIVLGGDGTTIGAGRALAPYNVPFIGVNAGRLGFITDVMIEEMDEAIPEMLSGRVARDERPLLEGVVSRNGEVLYKSKAINDVGITNGRIGGMVEYTIDVDGLMMSSQRADCVICSTSTGSTAYALASGGPILHPSVRGLVLVPVAPHTLTNRPIVLPEEAVIEIHLTNAKEGQAYFDMQDFWPMLPGDTLEVCVASERFTLLHPEGYDHFDILRRKLNWNAMPEGKVTARRQ